MLKNIKRIGLILLLLAYIFVCIKKPIFINYGIIYITIISGATFLSYVFKKKIDRTIIASILLLMIPLYIFGLLGHLKYGIYFNLIAFNLLGLLTWIIVLIKKEFKSFKEQFWTSGLKIFTLIFGFLGVTTYARCSTIWDEYTYWSISSKNMYYLDDFANNASSTLYGGLYPPFPTILQYFFCKVIGVYSQGIELFTIQTIGFAFLISIFGYAKNNKFVPVLAGLVSIIAIPAIFCDQLFYYTIYVDSILGIIIGYILFETLNKKEKCKFKYLSVGLAVIALAFTKATGIVVLAIIGFSLIVKVIISEIVSLKENENKNIVLNVLKNRFFKIAIYMIIVGILSYGSWMVYSRLNERRTTNVDEIEGTYDGNIVKYTFSTILKSFISPYSESEHVQSDMESLYNAPKDLLDKKYYSSMPFDMSAITWIVVLTIGMIIIYRELKDEKDKKNFCIHSICALLSLGLYIAFIQVSYMTMFSDKEGILHNSAQRYIGSFLMGMMIYVVFSYYKFINQDKITYSNSKLAIIALVVLIFTPMKPIFDVTINSGYYNLKTRYVHERTSLVSDEIKKVVDEKSKIYIIHQTPGMDTYGIAFRYYLTPVQTSSVNEMMENGKVSKENMINDMYNNYDYVFVANTNEYFNNNYKDIFENRNIEEWSLYKIIKKTYNKQIVLEKINIDNEQ